MLIAGAGMVSRPVGDILVSKGVSVIYGCRNIETAQRLAEQVGRGASAIALDVKRKEQLEQALSNVDLVVRYFSNYSTLSLKTDSFLASCPLRIVSQDRFGIEFSIF